MTFSWSLTARSLPVVVLYMAMALSPLVVEPAYFGYIVAYVIFIAICGRQLLVRQHSARTDNTLVIGWAAFAALALVTMLLARPGFRDLVRDFGAIGSFLFGMFVIPRALGKEWEKPLFAGLSFLALILAIWTIGAAAKAFVDGVGAYIWRGVYVPFAHNWLPYLIVVEYIRSRSGTDLKASTFRIGLCVLALLLSLSRTGLVLIAVFTMITFLFNARRWLMTGRGVIMTGGAIAAAILILPQLWGLDVVQQRVAAGIGSNDLSLGWRAMEQQTAVDYLTQGGWSRWLFGYGLGAQMPLPIGIVDFAGNPTIPNLHNSYYTYLLKFGAIGTIWIVLTICYQLLRAHLKRGGPPALLFGGTWFVLIAMGTGVTLHGLTEWSHLTFLGLGCALLAKAATSPRMVRVAQKSPTQMNTGPTSPEPAN